MFATVLAVHLEIMGKENNTNKNSEKSSERERKRERPQ